MIIHFLSRWGSARSWLAGLLLLLCHWAAPPRLLAQARAPALVGHRGLLHQAPENTLAGFGACLDLRFGFEVDIHRSKDGRLVCIHDADVRRTTDGQGKVADLDLAALRRLDAGAWFDAIYRGQRLPTFDEVLALVKARDVGTLIALDVKVTDATIAEDIVRLAEHHGVTRQLMCIGHTITDAKLRARFRTASPTIGIAALAQKAEDLPAALADRAADWVYIRFLPSAEHVARIHGLKRRVFLVGPLVAGQEPANWRRARAAGVDALLTDYPLECRTSWK